MGEKSQKNPSKRYRGEIEEINKGPAPAQREEEVKEPRNDNPKIPGGPI